MQPGGSPRLPGDAIGGSVEVAAGGAVVPGDKQVAIGRNARRVPVPPGHGLPLRPVGPAIGRNPEAVAPGGEEIQSIGGTGDGIPGAIARRGLRRPGSPAIRGQDNLAGAVGEKVARPAGDEFLSIGGTGDRTPVLTARRGKFGPCRRIAAGGYEQMRSRRGVDAGDQGRAVPGTGDTRPAALGIALGPCVVLGGGRASGGSQPRNGEEPGGTGEP